jgi:hypothetical protein
MESDLWDKRYQELVEFRNQHGHCEVPASFPGNPALGFWVANQRQLKKKGTLSEPRFHLLDQLGFRWVMRGMRHAAERAPRRDWEEMYQSLVAVHAQFGHSNVPYAWEDDGALGRWVQRQRDARKTGQLTDDQVSRLNALGFEWDSVLLRWKEMFSELLHFFEVNGHCNVPSQSDTWPKLGNWIAIQRLAFRKGKLSEEQISLLRSVGLVKEDQKPGKPNPVPTQPTLSPLPGCDDSVGDH